jgi:hypothetical protein
MTAVVCAEAAPIEPMWADTDLQLDSDIIFRKDAR